MFRFDSNRQVSFYNQESIWDELISGDSVYRLFREFAPVLIKQEDFTGLYCENNGRPSNEVLRMTMACMLQQMLNETDRGMELLTQVNIEIKYALFMALNEKGIDHANFHNHRERMMRNQLDVVYLDRFIRLMYYLGVLTGNEPFLTDTTHSVAPISSPTSIELIRQAMRLIVRWLSKQHKLDWEKLSYWPMATRYLFEIQETKEYKLEEGKKEQRFHEVVNEAEGLLTFLEQHPEFWKKDATLVSRALVLSRILHERVIENDDGTQSAKKRGFKDIIVSAIDMEARFGAKGMTKWRGYKVATVMIGNTGFIAAADTLKANEYDGNSLEKLVENTPVDQTEKPKIIGDSHYGSADNRIKMAEKNIQLVAPLISVKALEKAEEGFFINQDHTILTCPMNQTFTNYRCLENRRFFLLERGKCKDCPREPLCFKGNKKKKEVVIDDNFEVLLEAEKYNKTEDFKEDIRLRARIEPKQNELANVYGLRRIRYIGQRKLAFTSRMKALAANFQRLNRLLKHTEELKERFYEKFDIIVMSTA